MKDTPALDLRDIPSRPEWAALAARMSVQWGDAAVAGTDNEWKAIGEWVTTLEADRPEPSPEITAFTQTLIAGAPDFYTKLSRITDSIQKNIRYFIVERGIGGLQANHAADIFRNRYGDCKDKTTLLIAMLQVAGINAYYVPVDDRRGIVDPDDPSLVWQSHDHRDRVAAGRERSAPDCDREGARWQALSHLRPHQRAHAGRQSAIVPAGQLRNSRCRCLPAR